MMNYLLLNEKAGNGEISTNTESIKNKISGDFTTVDVTQIKDYKEFFSKINSEDTVILCGGDGTLNHFINDTNGIEFKNDILLYSSGTGNDFLFDLGADTVKDGPLKINKYLEKLPQVEVNGMTRLFINGIGFGIDGYCCEEADKMKEEGASEINYSSIAIKGILGKFNSRNAKVKVDGKEYSFDHVWIAASMNGRAYGGGMLCAPAQDRLNKEGLLSLVVYRGVLRIPSLIKFTTLFKGTHVKYKRNTHIITGKEIEVEFDKPCALQIDGETVTGVSSYKVRSMR